MYELIYTSTRQGVIAGRSGFTTVAMTEGFPPNLISPVENLSGYKNLFPPGHPDENANPVNFSCQHYRFGNTTYVVLSRISYAGLSYTGRSNVLAHHLLFTPEELEAFPGYAVSVLRASENFPPQESSPRMLKARSRQNIGFLSPPEGGETWRRLAGDARWAEYTAWCFRNNPGKALTLDFDPLRVRGSEILELIAETAALLTQEELRRFTFSTFCSSTGIGSPLFFRSYVRDSVHLGSIKRLEPGSVITLGEMNELPGSWLSTYQAGMETAEKTAPPEEIVLSADNEEKEECEAPAVQRPVILIPPEEEGISETEASEALETFPEDGADPDEKADVPVKKYLVMGIGVLVVLALCAAVFMRIFSDGAFVKKEEGKKENLSSEEEAVLAIPRQEKKSLPPPAKAPVISHPSGSVSAVEKKKAPAAEKRLSPSAVPQKQTQSPTSRSSSAEAYREELFGLYRAFHTGESFALPGFLKDTAALEVRLFTVGTLSKLADPGIFIRGNGTSRVEILPGESRDNGFFVEWGPNEKEKRGRMIFCLEDQQFRIRLPGGAAGEGVPRLQNVAQITFIAPGRKPYHFRPNVLPRFFTRFIEKDPGRISVEFSEMRYRYYLNVSDDLWTFRNFFTLRLDGRPLGGAGINRKKILLREWSTFHVTGKIRKRNNVLKQYLLAEKKYHSFAAASAKIPVPRLKKEKELRELMAEPLKKFLSAASGEAAGLQKAGEAVKNELLRLKETLTITDKVCTELTQDVDGFINEKTEARLRRETAERLKKNSEAAAKLFQTENRALEEMLSSLSRQLFAVYKKGLDSRKPVKVEENVEMCLKAGTMTKDVTITIIRKDAQ